MQNLLRALGDRRIALQDGKQSQKGFTLVELLVVVIIIGILAGIAIPVFLNQREAAWRGELEADLKNAGLVAETYGVENGGSFEGLGGTDATLEDLGFEQSNDDSSFVLTLAEGNQNFSIVATHPDITGKPTLKYDSADGGLQEWSDRTE